MRRHGTLQCRQSLPAIWRATQFPLTNTSPSTSGHLILVLLVLGASLATAGCGDPNGDQPEPRQDDALPLQKIVVCAAVCNCESLESSSGSLRFVDLANGRPLIDSGAVGFQWSSDPSKLSFALDLTAQIKPLPGSVVCTSLDLSVKTASGKKAYLTPESFSLKEATLSYDPIVAGKAVITIDGKLPLRYLASFQVDENGDIHTINTYVEPDGTKHYFDSKDNRTHREG